MLAAVPTWLDQNIALGSLLVLLVVAIAVLRYVRKATTRVFLMCVLLIAAGFVMSERDEFEKCGSTCGCDPGNVHVTVPLCDRY